MCDMHHTMADAQTALLVSMVYRGSDDSQIHSPERLSTIETANDDGKEKR
jgi:hypothetical protein